VVGVTDTVGVLSPGLLRANTLAPPRSAGPGAKLAMTPASRAAPSPRLGPTSYTAAAHEPVPCTPTSSTPASSTPAAYVPWPGRPASRLCRAGWPRTRRSLTPPRYARPRWPERLRAHRARAIISHNTGPPLALFPMRLPGALDAFPLTMLAPARALPMTAPVVLVSAASPTLAWLTKPSGPCCHLHLSLHYSTGSSIITYVSPHDVECCEYKLFHGPGLAKRCSAQRGT
jgi:hypothetical protein